MPTTVSLPGALRHCRGISSPFKRIVKRPPGGLVLPPGQLRRVHRRPRGHGGRGAGLRGRPCAGSSGDGFKGRVRELGRGAGTDGVYDGGGSATFTSSQPALRHHGTLAYYGPFMGVPSLTPMDLPSEGISFPVRVRLPPASPHRYDGEEMDGLPPPSGQNSASGRTAADETFLNGTPAGRKWPEVRSGPPRTRLSIDPAPKRGPQNQAYAT
jgi:hypothetical protein